MAANETDKFQKKGASTVTTLAAPGKALSATSITVGSTTNWPTDTGITFAIRVVDSAGELVSGTYTEWVGTVTSGTTLAFNATPVYGSDQVYAAGSTTQVFIPLSSYSHNKEIDGLLVEHRQDGTHDIAQIVDDNGLEKLKFTETASAVNEFTIANAATGNGPELQATGGDTNIDIELIPKGTGNLKVNGKNVAAGTAQMAAASSTGDLSTSYVSVANLTLGAGTWLLMSVGCGIASVAQFTTITGQFYNTTDASEIITQTFAASYASGTISARPAVSMAYLVTLTGTKQIDARYKLDTGSGSHSVTANLIAIPVAA